MKKTEIMKIQEQNNSTRLFTIRDIANWQLLAAEETKKVELPSLQRGFVWRPSQIEELWDSLLRGFPIGSFLLSHQEKQPMQLMDGQQRATSISLGHFDPWRDQAENAGFWAFAKGHDGIPTVWLDLLPVRKPEGQLFVPRVVTQSHPWGYKLANSRAALSVSDRQKALGCLIAAHPKASISYTATPVTVRFPFDAHLPVPLAFILAAITDSKGNWRQALLDRCTDGNFPHHHIRTGNMSADTAWIDLLRETLENKEAGHLDLIESSVKRLADMVIPGLLVSQTSLELEEEDHNGQDDPTLFIRFNSAGTRLGGEELTYSIFKAAFPQSKELVENIGLHFIPPSRVISLVSRLAWCDVKGGNYPPSMSVKEFRMRIRDHVFRERLVHYLEEDTAKNIFLQAFTLLRSEGGANLPVALVKHLINGNEELFLLLLRWFQANERPVGTKDEKAALAAFTALSWFGGNAKSKQRFVRSAWPTFSTGAAWTKDTLKQHLIVNDELLVSPLISPERLSDYLLKAVVTDGKFALWGDDRPDPQFLSASFDRLINEVTEEGKRDEMCVAAWDAFRSRLLWNRGLILFAQREYIIREFREFNQLESLEDANAPWDWDHIYPDSWVYYQHGIDARVRHWNNTIGNLRAMSLSANRGENNSLSPAQRLQDASIRQDSFVAEQADFPHWACVTGPLRKNDSQDDLLSAIIVRAMNIYREWYDTVGAGELLSFEV
jgi:hypothetical protein